MTRSNDEPPQGSGSPQETAGPMGAVREAFDRTLGFLRRAWAEVQEIERRSSGSSDGA